MTVHQRLAPAAQLGGYVELPPGKIAAVATFLEMRSPPADAPPRVARAELAFAPLAGDLARYRRLYGDVGRPWLWFSRAALGDAELLAIISRPDVEALAVRRDGVDVGLVELDFRQAGECELAFFGVREEAIGQGLGSAMIAEAIRRAFLRRIERLWLHTCTLDHPGALRFYRKAGFQPYRRALEIADDPRITGRLPRDAAPEVPLL